MYLSKLDCFSPSSVQTVGSPKKISNSKTETQPVSWESFVLRVTACFAGQVLSRALGGKTGRASVGWEVGLRDICLTDAFFSKPYAVGMPPILKVLEVHRDQVIDTII